MTYNDKKKDTGLGHINVEMLEASEDYGIDKLWTYAVIYTAQDIYHLA